MSGFKLDADTSAVAMTHRSVLQPFELEDGLMPDPRSTSRHARVCLSTADTPSARTLAGVQPGGRVPAVRDNPAQLRYELIDDDGDVIGEIRYRREPGAVALVHTEVDPAYEGQGLAGLLVEGALRDLRERGLRMIPICPYVHAWLRRHPDQADVVTSDPATPE